MVVRQSQAYAPGYIDLTFGGAELEEVMSCVFLGQPLTLILYMRHICAKLY